VLPGDGVGPEIVAEPIKVYSFFARYNRDANNFTSQSTTNLQEVYTGTAVATYVGQTGQLTRQGSITINLQ
jgi:isocitrate/isopropylmalate dehydrogenase